MFFRLVLVRRTIAGPGITETDCADPNMQLDFASGCAYIGWQELKKSRNFNNFMEIVMKLVVPFDTSIKPPKRFWSALLRPGVQPEDPEAEFEILRCSSVPGAPFVLTRPEHRLRVSNAEGHTPWVQLKRAFEALGTWFVRRDAQEAEEQLAASQGLEHLERRTRLRDAECCRHLRT